MISIKNLVSLVAVFALLLVTINSVSAFASISSVEVSGVQGLTAGTVVASFAGDTVPVLVLFNALQNASDVRVKAWISGESGYSVSSERFDVISGNVYSKLLAVSLPKNIDPNEPFDLQIEIESRNGGIGDMETISLSVQRESYAIELLDVDMSNTVKAGESLSVDVVLKNRGRQLAEDTFVRVSIPALGIEERSYFGDLSAVDQSNPDKEDASERIMNVRIPANARAGIYTVEITAFNADSEQTVTKKVAVSGASEDSAVASSVKSKTFAINEKGSYSLTLVNAGSKIALYELSFETPSGLTVSTDESVIAVPAGSSKTVKFDASADKAGAYSFAVNVHSNDELVARDSYTATVEGKSFAANATVILTVVLAIIFVVLLVVLIVLLTKKPQKSEEFGESYY
jgi:uncharacterized membrane protein